MEAGHARRLGPSASRIEWAPEVRCHKFSQEQIHLRLKKCLQSAQHKIAAIGGIDKERGVLGDEQLAQGAPFYT